MEQNKYQVISIILAFKAINQLHRHLGCLLSETLISCCHYQYTKEGKNASFCIPLDFSILLLLKPQNLTDNRNNTQGKQPGPSNSATNHPRTDSRMAVCSISPVTYRKE